MSSSLLLVSSLYKLLPLSFPTFPCHFSSSLALTLLSLSLSLRFTFLLNSFPVIYTFSLLSYSISSCSALLLPSHTLIPRSLTFTPESPTRTHHIAAFIDNNEHKTREGIPVIHRGCYVTHQGQPDTKCLFRKRLIRAHGAKKGGEE